MISWLPPRRPNGILTKYTVHIRVLDQGQEVKTIKSSLPAQNLHHEATGLKQRESYEAWVTASTKIGQGPRTPVIKLQLSNTGKPSRPRPNFPRGEEKDFLPPSFSSSSSSRYLRGIDFQRWLDSPTIGAVNARQEIGPMKRATFMKNSPLSGGMRPRGFVSRATILPRWIDFRQRKGRTRSMREREETVVDIHGVNDIIIGIVRATNTGHDRVTESVINVDTITYYPFPYYFSRNKFGVKRTRFLDKRCRHSLPISFRMHGIFNRPCSRDSLRLSSRTELAKVDRRARIYIYIYIYTELAQSSENYAF